MTEEEPRESNQSDEEETDIVIRAPDSPRFQKESSDADLPDSLDDEGGGESGEFPEGEDDLESAPFQLEEEVAEDPESPQISSTPKSDDLNEDENDFHSAPFQLEEEVAEAPESPHIICPPISSPAKSVNLNEDEEDFHSPPVQLEEEVARASTIESNELNQEEESPSAPFQLEEEVQETRSEEEPGHFSTDPESIPADCIEAPKFRAAELEEEPSEPIESNSEDQPSGIGADDESLGVLTSHAPYKPETTGKEGDGYFSVQQPQSARSRNPRSVKFEHLNTSSRIRTSIPKTPRPYVPPLAPSLQESPYLEDPFAYAAYLNETRSARSERQLYVPARPFVPPLKSAATPRHYRIDPGSDYPKRAAFLDRTDKEFRDESIAKGKAFFENAPYHEDHFLTRERSHVLSKGKAKARWARLKEQRRKEVAECRIAIPESYKHDLYHLDELYDFKFKFLRVVPVTNRLHTDLPRNKLPYI
jgi:hypothetical protein